MAGNVALPQATLVLGGARHLTHTAPETFGGIDQDADAVGVTLRRRGFLGF